MFPLLRKTLLFPPCCSSSSSQVRTFLIRFPLFGFSSPPPPQPPPPPPPPPPQQPNSRDVEVSVWWNVDNCSVPSGVSFWNVAPSIMAAVRANGIKGKIDIRAYSHFSKLSDVDEYALMSTGIILHSFRGGTDQAYQQLLMDLNDWVSKNPPPVHLFLISDDRYDRVFSGILHRLRMNNYNILVAYPGRASDILRSAATIMWHWSSMLKREDLIGKHFNYPPDGPFDSWYGDSEVPLENLFSAIEEPTSSQNAKIHEPSSDTKLGKVPKSVSRKVKKILSSYPDGISIGDLRAELTKCLPLGKHFYDHKSFSNFLVSIPHVQLLYLADCNFDVHLIPSTTFDAVKKNKQRDGTSTQKLHSECKNADGIPIFPLPQYNELEEEEEDKVRVSVWWDIDTCGVPSGVSFSKVMPSVMGSLRTHGIKCPVDIHAYGNLSQLPEINQEVLFLTGIDLHHVPGGKKHAHRYFMDWVSKNPPPAHLFIISGERDYNFACTVNQLRMNNYNILLACPAKTSFDLCHSATIMWQWSLMLKGDFTGKHFMFPPDWYGDLKVPRENPFSAAKVPTSSQSAEIHMPSSDIKLGEVPKSVSRQQPHCKQLKEDKVSVSVWWDFDYCGVPSGVSVSKIAPSITGALRTNGINGPIDFRAYGDVSHFSKFEQTTLSLTGIHLCNITDEMKKNRKRKKTCDYLFLDLANWVFNNPPPFHLFIICGDVSINGLWMLHDLRMSNYNILVACPGRTYDVLRSATTIMWHWSSILKGEDLTGKHFNYPPDGPFDSWYGDSRVNLENPFSAADGSTSSQAEILEYIESGELSKVTLENPFSTAEESTYSQNAEIHEPSSDIQSSEVPESVSRQVKNNKQRDSTSTQKRIDTSRILAWNTFSM